MISCFDSGKGAVLKISYLGQKQHEFITGTSLGDVLLWDIRQNASTLKVETGMTDMTGFAIHENANLIAW